MPSARAVAGWSIWITVLVFAPAAVGQSLASQSSSEPAERLRAFLASKGALADNETVQIAPAMQAYINEGLSPLANCGIREVIDNPAIARSNTLNLFGVRFEHPAESFCAKSHTPTSCYLLADNCITIGSSVFCDVAYLNRLLDISLAALLYAWSGVRDGKRDHTGNIYLSPIKTLALIDLARVQNATRSAKSVESLGGLEELPFILATEEVGRSTLLMVLNHVVSNLVLSHELAHVEQNVCPGVQYYDASRYEHWARVHDEITCSGIGSMVAAELKADLRASDILAQLLERDLETLARSGGGFLPELDDEMRLEFERLLPIAREVALLAIVYSLEYQLLVHMDPEGGLEALYAMPPPDEGSRKTTEHLIKTGFESADHLESGHVDPALRALFVIDALDAGKLGKLNPQLTTSFVGFRLKPFIIGRLQNLQRQRCGRPDDEFMPHLMQYVLSVFDSEPQDDNSDPFDWPELTTRGSADNWSMTVIPGWIGGNSNEINRLSQLRTGVWGRGEVREILSWLQEQEDDVILAYVPDGRDNTIQVYPASGYFSIDAMRRISVQRWIDVIKQRYPSLTEVVGEVIDNLITGGYPAYRVIAKIRQPDGKRRWEVVHSVFLDDRREIQNFRLNVDPDVAPARIEEFDAMLRSVEFH